MTTYILNSPVGVKDAAKLREKWMRIVMDSDCRPYEDGLSRYFRGHATDSRSDFWDRSWWTDAMIEVDRAQEGEIQ